MIKKFILLFFLFLISMVSADSFPGFPPCATSPPKTTMCSMKPLEFYPTQFMIGYDLAYQKQIEIESFDKSQLEKYLKKNMIPVVIGPDNRFYMTDRHHHC